jgi:hypothetical protein
MALRGDAPDTRYDTHIEDGVVYVGHPKGPLRVGDVAQIVALVGGPAWTIHYSEWTRQRWPMLDTSDEGLTVDVVDVLSGMTHSEPFVELLAAFPLTLEGCDVPPRLGLFAGKLLWNLQSGVE